MSSERASRPGPLRTLRRRADPKGLGDLWGLCCSARSATAGKAVHQCMHYGRRYTPQGPAWRPAVPGQNATSPPIPHRPDVGLHTGRRGGAIQGPTHAAALTEVRWTSAVSALQCIRPVSPPPGWGEAGWGLNSATHTLCSPVARCLLLPASCPSVHQCARNRRRYPFTQRDPACLIAVSRGARPCAPTSATSPLASHTPWRRGLEPVGRCALCSASCLALLASCIPHPAFASRGLDRRRRSGIIRG